MTNTQTPPKFDESYKTPIQTTDIIIGCIIGTLFTTISLIDLSVVEFGQAAFVAQFFLWKANAPFLKPLLTVITLLLPLALIGAGMNIVHVFTKKSTTRRNICDTINIICLVLVIANTVMYIGPMEEQIFDLGLTGKASALETITLLLPSLREKLAISLILNVIMLILPFFHIGDIDIIPRISVNPTVHTKSD